MTVKESFEHTQHVSCCLEPCCANPACFHYPEYFQPCLHVDVPKSPWGRGVQDSGGGGWAGPVQAGLPEEPLTPSQNPPILPALLLLCTQEDQPCPPAP